MIAAIYLQSTNYYITMILIHHLHTQTRNKEQHELKTAKGMVPGW